MRSAEHPDWTCESRLHAAGACCSCGCARGCGGARISAEEISRRLGIGSLRFLCAAVVSAAAVTAVTLPVVAPAASARSVPAACRASSLSARFSGQGASQTIVGELTVTNTSTTSCRLTGRPLIAMRTSGRPATLDERHWSSSAFPDIRFSSTILIGPRRSASVRFQWLNWCNPKAPRSSPPSGNAAEGKRPSQILVMVAPGTQPTIANVPGGLRQLGLPRCLEPDRPASSIYVTLWTSPSTAAISRLTNDV